MPAELPVLRKMICALMIHRILISINLGHSVSQVTIVYRSISVPKQNRHPFNRLCRPLMRYAKDAMEGAYYAHKLRLDAPRVFRKG